MQYDVTYSTSNVPALNFEMLPLQPAFGLAGVTWMLRRTTGAVVSTEMHPWTSRFSHVPPARITRSPSRRVKATPGRTPVEVFVG